MYFCFGIPIKGRIPVLYILDCLFGVIRVEWAASMTYILHMYVIEAL